MEMKLVIAKGVAGLVLGGAFFMSGCVSGGPAFVTGGGVVVPTEGDADEPYRVSALKYTLQPLGARQAGAKWKISGQNGFPNASGAQITLLAGSYPVEFKPVTGYNTPAGQTVTVPAGQVRHKTAIYTKTVAKRARRAAKPAPPAEPAKRPQPTEKPVEKPVDRPVEKPADAPAEPALEKPDQPKPAEQPAEQAQ